MIQRKSLKMKSQTQDVKTIIRIIHTMKPTFHESDDDDDDENDDDDDDDDDDNIQIVELLRRNKKQQKKEKKWKKRSKTNLSKDETEYSKPSKN